MKLPHFDINRIPLNPWGGDYISAVIAEETRVCEPIDHRLGALAAEFGKLSRKAKELGKKYETASGFFVRCKIRNQLNDIARRIAENHFMRNVLTRERLKRTY